MADSSKIEWCDSTFNPWAGCTRISPACDHCYAAVSTAARNMGAVWGAGQPRVRTSEKYWNQPLRWAAKPFYECMPCGWRGDKPTHPADGGLWTCPACHSDAVITARRRVFCASLADVFDNQVDPAWRRDLFALIAATPELDWLLLTKRIGNVMPMLEEQKQRGRNYAEWAFAGDWLDGKPPANVWLGATICNQVEADRDIPKLHATPAAVRFLSMEPLLGPVDLWHHFDIRVDQVDGGALLEGAGHTHGIDWVIVGGESGHGARPMHPHWVRNIRDQCASASVHFLFKQWGSFHVSEITEGGALRPPVPLSAPFKRLQLATSPSDPFVPVEPLTPAGDVFRPGNVIAVPGDKKDTGRLLDRREHTAFPTVGDHGRHRA